MKEGDCEKPWCLRRCVTSMVAMVISATILHPGYTFARGVQKATLPDIRVDSSIRTLLEGVDSLVKDAKHYKYPQDNFYKVIQDKIPKTAKFPCENIPDKPLWRSKTRPTSVHMLRPGDIDVIASMGDSVSTANGAREDNMYGVLVQDRGVSFTSGGIGTWHDIITLPNIIKVFNPNLVGYSLGRGDFMSYNAQLNVGIPGSLDDELFYQVKIFMNKLRWDKRIDFANDWKLLSILIGHNDVCSYQCYERNKHSPNAHRRHLIRALDFLKKNVPRLLVNIISILDPTITARVPTDFICRIMNRMSCACIYTAVNFKEGLAQVSTEVCKYQDIEREVAFSGRYEDKEDFAVVFQPFLQAFNGPKNINETENPILMPLVQRNFPIWTAECFHFNQRGLAAAATQLWNNMLEPVGNKSTNLASFLDIEFKCPTKEHPYIFTRKNSEALHSTEHDDGNKNSPPDS